MKSLKTIFISLIVLVSTVAVAQSKSDQLFDAFRNKPGVSYFAFTKSMTDAFNIDLDDEAKTIKGDLSEIRFLSYNPKKGNLNGPDFITKAAGLLPGAYDRIVEVDSENNAEVWMLGNKRKASEFHVFIRSESSDDNQFLISFYGDFDIDDVEGVREIGLSLSVDK
ncbi:DUF4252 domain-containing protein [uncultured Sunxiuqinia sp.]|uniref:DUF4252 domain-containing protein n=1 Tax=uncultured Sunxiuqinia sp. TaxID=1573825 RepID=UPI0030DAADCE